MKADQLTFMPPVGKTETLYSVCASLHHLRGGVSWKKAGVYFFKDEMASWHRQMPCNLDHFCEVTRYLLGSPEKILEDRTLTGFYARFLEPKALNNLIIQARNPRLKHHKSADPDAKKLRLCPECVVEDRKELGRGTWRLEHQLPGAKVCMHHGRDLHQVVEHNFEAGRYWMRPEDFVGNEPQLWDVKLTHERASWVSLAKILWILKSHQRVSPPLLHHVLAQKLVQVGGLKSARFLSSKTAENWLKKGPYGSSLYSPFLESDLAPLKGNWLKFLDGRGAHHPLRWAAVLAACMTAQELSVELERASPLQGTLGGRWDISGQIHKDLLPKHIWDALLDGIDIRDAAEHWGLSAASLNRALRLNPELKAIRDEKIEKDILQPKREWVCRFLQVNPSATRANLRREDSASLRWLDLNDQEWLWRHVLPTKSGRWPQMPLFPS